MATVSERPLGREGDDMAVMASEVVELTRAEARAAARNALEASGYTFDELAHQAERNDFDDLCARMTWEAVRYVGSPESA